jgi:hypothetical protein
LTKTGYSALTFIAVILEMAGHPSRQSSAGAPITRRKRHLTVEPIDELAINGPEAELVDVVDGRRFLYHFEQGNLGLQEIVQQGSDRFQQRYGQLPTIIILSASYGLGNGHRLHGLEVVAVQDLPWYHFWFGPKPDYCQLTLGL